MSVAEGDDDRIHVPGASGVPGLVFRRFRGSSDIAPMVDVMNRSWEADGAGFTIHPRDLEHDFAHPINFDPALNLVIAEVQGELVGCGRVAWRQMKNDVRVYVHQVHLIPELRSTGVRRAMLRFNEGRLREIAAEHPPGQKRSLESWAKWEENDWSGLMLGEGYAPSWHVLEMLRENLDEIPDFQLPEGIEVRPVKPEHYRKVWDATREALRDENSFAEENWGEEAFQKYRESPRFQPSLWQIAWEGDEIVGGVHVFINKEENEAMNRTWGHTEEVTVRRPWRGRGIAKALLARSLEVVRAQGMDAATLDVDSDNPSGALRLYQSLGYREIGHFTFYRKPL